MAKTDYDLIVIGAGSGGLTAAIGGAQIGAKTLLVEKTKMGGDCTHHGCVPSKTLIKAGKIARNLKNYEKYGLFTNHHESKNLSFDLEKVLEKVQATIESIYLHETPDEIRKLGVDVEMGSPMFINKNTISINNKEFSAKKIVISTGARARIPKVKGLDQIKFMTNKEIFNPKKFKSLTVIGGGPIGSELAQAFAALGIKVNLVEHGSNILSREDKEAALLVQESFEKDGINIYKKKNFIEIKEENNMKIITIEDLETNKKTKITSEEILVAVGRVPNIEGLGLENAGIEFTNRGIKIDARTRTTNNHIHAIGDVAAGWQFTHFANHQGKVALTNIIFKIPARYEMDVIPRVTFTSPELASVGVVPAENDINIENKEIFILKKDYSKVDRAITESNTTGFFKIACDKKGFIKGAVIVGDAAGELIGEIALAMKNDIKITKLADTIHPYPTYGYGLRNTADQFRGLGFSENKKKWLKKIFRLRGN